MSALLERYERQATVLGRGRPRSYRPITDVDFADTEALNLVAGEQMRSWKQIQRKLQASGEPTALSGGIAGLEALPPSDALAAGTMSATEQAMWTAATYTPLPVGTQRSPVDYDFYASFTVVTAATASPTMTLTPRWGTAITDATLGADAQTALAVSITTNWQVSGELSVRGTGGPGGTNARVYGTFNLKGKSLTAGNGAADIDHVFGYTLATGDSTLAKGLFMGIVSTITTPTWAMQQIRFGSWN